MSVLGSLLTSVTAGIASFASPQLNNFRPPSLPSRHPSYALRTRLFQFVVYCRRTSGQAIETVLLTQSGFGMTSHQARFSCAASSCYLNMIRSVLERLLVAHRCVFKQANPSRTFQTSICLLTYQKHHKPCVHLSECVWNLWVCKNLLAEATKEILGCHKCMAQQL